MELSIWVLSIPIIIGIILAFITKNMESKKSAKIQLGVWVITGLILIVGWLFTK